MALTWSGHRPEAVQELDVPQGKPSGSLPLSLRLGYIDGLRAIAALGVLVYHAGMAPRPGRPPDDSLLGRSFLFGAHGVDLFFVISGFCLAYPYLGRLRKTGALAFDAAEFGARRLVRILPPYYLAIAIFAIVFSALGLHSPGLTPLALVQQVFFLDKDLSYLSNVFWTLAVELRWYVAFPFLLYTYSRAPSILGPFRRSCSGFGRRTSRLRKASCGDMRRPLGFRV